MNLFDVEPFLCLKRNFDTAHCDDTTKKTTYCGGPIAAGAKPAAICRLLRRVLALPLNMDLLRRDNRPAAIVLVYCGVLLRRANDPP